MAVTTFDFVITIGSNNNGSVVGYWNNRWSSSIDVMTITPPGGREINVERIAHAQDAHKLSLWLTSSDGNTVTDWSDLVPDRIKYSRGDTSIVIPITVDISSNNGSNRLRLTQDDPEPPVTVTLETIFGQTGVDVQIQFQYGELGLPIYVGNVEVKPYVGNTELTAIYVGDEKVYG